MRRTLRPADLFLLAAAAVAALALLSSPAETEVASFAELRPDTTSVVVCLVEHCRTTDHGYLLDLSDAAGMQAEAFCRFSDAAAPPAERSAVRVWVTPSDEDGFLYVSRLEPLPAPEVRQALIYPWPLIDTTSSCSSPSTIPTLPPGCAPPSLRWS